MGRAFPPVEAAAAVVSWASVPRVRVERTEIAVDLARVAPYYSHRVSSVRTASEPYLGACTESCVGERRTLRVVDASAASS